MWCKSIQRSLHTRAFFLTIPFLSRSDCRLGGDTARRRYTTAYTTAGSTDKIAL